MPTTRGASSFTSFSAPERIEKKTEILDFPQPVNVPITYMQQQGSCLDHWTWTFPLIELMMGLGAMEPFGLGHVVNERFALEVRKVHGRQPPVE